MSSKSSMSLTNILTPEQNTLLKKMLGDVGGQVGTAAPSYGGQSYVPMSGGEANFINSTQLDPQQLAIRESAYNNALSGQSAINIDPQVRESYYQNSFYNPMMRDYQNNIAPQVMEAASGAGFRSSDTLRQMGNANTDFATNLAAQRGKLLWDDTQMGYQGQENAATRQAQLAGSPTNVMTGAYAQMGEGAAYARAIAQERVASDMQRWLSGEEVNGVYNPAYNQNNSLALALLGLSPYAVGQKTSGSNTLESAIGGISGGLGQALGQLAGSYDWGGSGSGNNIFSNWNYGGSDAGYAVSNQGGGYGGSGGGY